MAGVNKFIQDLLPGEKIIVDWIDSFRAMKERFEEVEFVRYHDGLYMEVRFPNGETTSGWYASRAKRIEDYKMEQLKK